MEKIFYKCDKLLPCSLSSTCGAPYCEYTSDSKHGVFGAIPKIWSSEDGKFKDFIINKKQEENNFDLISDV